MIGNERGIDILRDVNAAFFIYAFTAMIPTSDIVTLVFFAVVLLLFVWLFYDSRKESRSREATMLDERKQLISILQQNAVQLPAIANALQQINDNLDELNKHAALQFKRDKAG